MHFCTHRKFNFPTFYVRTINCVTFTMNFHRNEIYPEMESSHELFFAKVKR